ncbi:MAG: site-specific DNA-methyltransferase [Elusimicrobia bacterium]|nr:site-specific DNA-methyltransferase [Elusimicrobiota bacterium]
MPTLNWIGKEAVVNHHRQVPFRLLRDVPSLSCGDPGSGNLIVQGDNLLALKALLPYYAGQVKCIYIDPPYNTGNEGWAYNDNTNSPVIKKWLGEVVGKEGETLDRHDRWLCMMYPRLSLLKQLLHTDGLIFVSIDDNEAATLKLLLDEIFGPQNFVQQIIWKNKYGPGAMTRGFGNVHEYIFCYSRTPLDSIEAPLSEEDAAKYKSRDSKHAIRGGFITQPLATRSKDPRPNLVYPIVHAGEEIWPDKQWIWSKERLLAAISNDEVVFRKSKGKWSVRFKQYLHDDSSQMRLAKPISIMNGPFNQDGTWEIENIFGEKVFSNPKPRQLVEALLSMVVNGQDNRDALVLDSFGGSGTTAHAVLSLNKKDGGNRRFISIEMEPKIAQAITSVRIRKASEGYREISTEKVEGLGGGFRYCELGDSLFDESGKIRPSVTFPELARHIYFSETGETLPKERVGKSPFLGECRGVGIYLLYNGILGDKTANGGNILTRQVLGSLPPFKGQRIIYCAGNLLGKDRLESENLVVRQTPYEIKVS